MQPASWSSSSCPTLKPATLAGAELAVGSGWIGLRSHPRPVGAVTYGGPAVPPWLDVALRDVVPDAGTTPEMEDR